MQQKNLRLALFGLSGYLILTHLLLFVGVLDKTVKGYGDFANFYAAATIVKGGGGHTLYDPRLQARVQSALYPEVKIRQGPLLYIHPPFEVVLFLPLAYLPYPIAYAAWASGSLVLLILIIRMLAPGLTELKALYLPLPSLMFLAFYPIFIGLLQGQDSMLVLFLFAVAYLYLKRGKELAFGFLVGLALFKFQLVVAFLAPLALRRRWKVLLGFSAAGVLLLALSIMVVGPDGLVSYVTLLRQLSQGLESPAVQGARGIRPDSMANLRGTLFTLGRGVIPYGGITVVVAVISLGLVVWCATKWPSGPPHASPGFDLTFSLNVVVALLASFYLFLSDYTLLALPLAILANYLAPPRPHARALRLALLGLVVVFYLTPAYILLGRNDELHLYAWPLLLLAFGISRELWLRQGNLAPSLPDPTGVPSPG